MEIQNDAAWKAIYASDSTNVTQKWTEERAQSVVIPFPEVTDSADAARQCLECDRMRLLERHAILTQFMFKDTLSLGNMDRSLDALCEHAQRATPTRLGDWLDDYITSVCVLHVKTVTFHFPRHARAVVCPSENARIAVAITFYIAPEQVEKHMNEALASRPAHELQHFTRSEWSSPSVPPTLTIPGASVSLRDVLCIPVDICYMDPRWTVSSAQK